MPSSTGEILTGQPPGNLPCWSVPTLSSLPPSSLPWHFPRSPVHTARSRHIIVRMTWMAVAIGGAAWFGRSVLVSVSSCRCTGSRPASRWGPCRQSVRVFRDRPPRRASGVGSDGAESARARLRVRRLVGRIHHILELRPQHAALGAGRRQWSGCPQRGAPGRRRPRGHMAGLSTRRADGIAR